ncbi:hypothetical protein PRZ48_007829 [Zasmidium cellare]|uniref:Uncharacterized protein n=1 Tax=Zasmidium cellare TaxID=395010 RepID=A0ABR0ELK9_ZASCE|nr:hypothetical protein PRZ48_007829 [Zasmidium cellare]
MSGTVPEHSRRKCKLVPSIKNGFRCLGSCFSRGRTGPRDNEPAPPPRVSQPPTRSDRHLQTPAQLGYGPIDPASKSSVTGDTRATPRHPARQRLPDPEGDNYDAEAQAEELESMPPYREETLELLSVLDRETDRVNREWARRYPNGVP